MHFKMATIKFLGGAGEVSGACYLIEAQGAKFLLDCGLFQGASFCDKRNYEHFGFDAKTIDFVILSHAHIDHSGRLPKLMHEGFEGRIYATSATADLVKIMIEDAQGLLEEEAQRKKIQPLYKKEDAEKMEEHLTGVDYGKKINPKKGITFQFLEAGHILGSAIVEVWIKDSAQKETKIVFSGDLGNPQSPLLRPAEKVSQADYLIIESAYGGRNHETKEKRKDILEDAIEDTINKKGVLMIPAFAVERVQQILFEIDSLVEQGRIPSVPVFLDSPLAIKATQIYKEHEADFNEQTQKMISEGEEIFSFPGLKLTLAPEDSKAILDVPPPKIIIAGSGNSMGGRILHHEKNYLSDARNAILIVGYQNSGSLGRKLIDGAKEVKIYDEIVPVRARAIHLDGYSAHADQKTLLNFVKEMRYGLKKIFVVQGEHNSSFELAQRVKDDFAVSAEIPVLGLEYKLL